MIKNIVVGYDSSPPAQVALEQALDLAEASAARIHIAAAIEEFSPDSEADILHQPDVLDILDAANSLGEEAEGERVTIPAYLEEARLRCQEAHISCAVSVGRQRAAGYLRQCSWLADLLVVGRCSRRRLTAGEIGRTAHRLLQTAQQPTLVCAENYITVTSLMVVYEQSVIGGHALAVAGEVGAKLNVPVDVVVAGHDRQTLHRWLAAARHGLQAYHVEGNFDSSAASLSQALTTLALERTPSLIVMPHTRLVVGSWRLPAVYHTVLQLPDAMLLVVP